MKKDLYKHIDLTNIPKNKSRYNWLNSIGKECKFIYDDISGYVTIVDYNYKKHKLYIKYLDNEIFEINTDNFSDCAFGKLLGKITSEFKIKLGKTIKNKKQDFIIIDREKHISANNKCFDKIYKYHCNKCGHEDWLIEHNLLKGIGCSCCGITPKKVIEGINDIPTTALWMVKYFQGGYDEAKLYTKSSSKTIFPICPDCGRIKNRPMSINSIYTNKTIRCTCKDGRSYPEKIMFNILEQLHIDFLSEYSPDWIKPLRYDFYFELGNKKYIVEMDGGIGHGNKVVYNNSIYTVEYALNIDNYKDNLANINNIDIIRIDCKISDIDYIKTNIFNTKLLNILELSSIDWIKCDEFALSNLVKKACEIKKENENLSTSDIGLLLHLNRSTICKYLKEGSKFGWCNYNPNNERMKSLGHKVNIRKVEVFKNDTSLGIFESTNDIERKSEACFGVKLLQSCISLVCNGKQKSHKGFIFKYINNENQEVVNNLSTSF